MTRAPGERSWAWTVATVVIPAAVLLTMTVPGVVLAGRLPDPVAAHWTAGVPDGNVSWRTGLAVVTVVWAASWVGIAGLPAQTVIRAGFLLPMVLFVGGVLAATVLAAVLLNLDAPSWDRASHAGRLAAYSPLAAGSVLALLGVLLQRTASTSLEPAPPRHAGKAPVLRLRRGERVMWVGRVRQGPMWVAAPLAGLLVLGVAGSDRFAWALAGSCLLVGLLLQLTVWVGPAGVRVGLGPWGWPARKIKLDRVLAASAVDVDPAYFGGLGYRLGRSQTTAIVLRRGEALRVETVSGKVLLVTVDGAAEAAAVLNGLLDQRRHDKS